MQTHLKISAEALVRIALQSCLSVTLACTSFGSGWYLRYAVKEGIPAATQRFHERVEESIIALRRITFFNRIFDAVSGEDQEDLGFPLYQIPGRGPHTHVIPDFSAPKPTPAPSVAPSVAPPRKTIIKKPKRKPVMASALLDQMLQFLDGCADLSPADRKLLSTKVKTYGKLKPPYQVMSLIEEVDKLVYIKADVRTNLIGQILELTEVDEVYKLGGPDETERLVWGWDVPDMRAALDKKGVPAVRSLCAGRPAKFFVDLSTAQGPFRTCRENLQALQDGSARPEGASATDPKLTPVSCPAHGEYARRPGRPWSCSVHQTLAEPFPLAAKLIRYMDPVDAALKTQVNGQVEQAYADLNQLITRYPNHVVAANGMAELYFQRKDWAALKEFLTKWSSNVPETRKNVRWSFYLAMAAHALGENDLAKDVAHRAVDGVFDAAPPNVSTRREFYLLQDRAQEVFEAASKGMKLGDYATTQEDAFPSSVCYHNLSNLRDSIAEFTQKYPASHPDLFKLRVTLTKAAQILSNNPTPEKAAKVQSRVTLINARIADILADKSGEFFWKSLSRLLVLHPPQSCPSRGRYVFQGHEFLQCSVHPDIFLDALAFKSARTPTKSEEDELTRSLLQGVLAADTRRRDCFSLQKKYLEARGTQSIPAGNITSSTSLPDGQLVRCPEGGVLKAATGTGATPRVGCSYHGSYQDYFAGYGEMPKKEEGH